MQCLEHDVLKMTLQNFERAIHRNCFDTRAFKAWMILLLLGHLKQKSHNSPVSRILRTACGRTHQTEILAQHVRR